MPAPRSPIIAHHLIWTLYGHWLPNDPRGSGSEDVRDPKLAALGEAHFGRKPASEQPSRGELREFYREAAPRLGFAPFWIDEAKRQALGSAVAGLVAERTYTVWGCAILANHMHMVIRRHRDDALAMWRSIAEGTLQSVRGFEDVGATHPVWAARPYKVFLRTPVEVRGRVRYVTENPAKEGLAAQSYDFVQPYGGWPLRKPR